MHYRDTRERSTKFEIGECKGGLRACNKLSLHKIHGHNSDITFYIHIIQRGSGVML